MNWKASLDRYLTTEPPDDFTPFCERVYDLISDNVYEQMEKAKFVNSDTENYFLSELFQSESPELTAFHLINFFYTVRAQGLILKGEKKRAKHVAKFYADNLYLLK